MLNGRGNNMNSKRYSYSWWKDVLEDSFCVLLDEIEENMYGGIKFKIQGYMSEYEKVKEFILTHTPIGGDYKIEYTIWADNRYNGTFIPNLVLKRYKLESEEHKNMVGKPVWKPIWVDMDIYLSIVNILDFYGWDYNENGSKILLSPNYLNWMKPFYKITMKLKRKVKSLLGRVIK